MKKITLIIIVLILIIASLIGFRQMNISKVRKEEAKKEIINKEAGIKPEQALIEDLIRNYRNIYINLVNDKGLDFSFLDNVLDKNSSYYKTVIKDIEDKRKAKIKLQSENIEVGDLQEDEKGYKVKVKENLKVISDKEKSEEVVGYYIIKTDKKKSQIVDYTNK